MDLQKMFSERLLSPDERPTLESHRHEEKKFYGICIAIIFFCLGVIAGWIGHIALISKAM